MKKSRVIQGGLITPRDMALIPSLLREPPEWHRTRLSRQLCRIWGWTDETGRMKDMACRSLLLKLEGRGEIVLPARRREGANHRRGCSFQPVLHDRRAIEGSLRSLLPIRLIHAEGGWEEELWRTLLHLYHYLGFTTRVGKSMSYLALDANDRAVGCLLFGAAAWKTAPRDRFIGWSAAQRERNLYKVVNNMRFLIPPWVRVPHLASHILGKALRQVSQDWVSKYGHAVYLAESFVDLSRFRGTCYRASNWIMVGQTTGRGRNDSENKFSVPRKAIYVRPLHRRFREKLLEG